jgi:hypothetical protein
MELTVNVLNTSFYAVPLGRMPHILIIQNNAVICVNLLIVAPTCYRAIVKYKIEDTNHCSDLKMLTKSPRHKQKMPNIEKAIALSVLSVNWQ